VIHQEGRGPLLHRLEGEFVAVPLGPEGHEAGARLERPGIHRQRRRHHGAIAEELPAHLGGGLEEGPEAHAAPPVPHPSGFGCAKVALHVSDSALRCPPTPSRSWTRSLRSCFVLMRYLRL